MYSDLLALKGTSTTVTVWSKGSGSIAAGVTVDSSSDASKLVLTNGSNTWKWDPSDVGGFYV